MKANATKSFERLIEPHMIGALVLKNRVVMSSMGRRLAGLWAEVNDATIAWYADRAGGGMGLLTVKATHMAAALYPVRGVIRMPRANDDCFSSGLFSLAQAARQGSAKISIQLSVERSSRLHNAIAAGR